MSRQFHNSDIEELILSDYTWAQIDETHIYKGNDLPVKGFPPEYRWVCKINREFRRNSYEENHKARLFYGRHIYEISVEIEL